MTKCWAQAIETYRRIFVGYYKKYYKYRKCFSNREMFNIFSNIDDINDNIIILLSMDYNDITFEKW